MMGLIGSRRFDHCMAWLMRLLLSVFLLMRVMRLINRLGIGLCKCVCHLRRVHCIKHSAQHQEDDGELF